MHREQFKLHSPNDLLSSVASSNAYAHELSGVNLNSLPHHDRLNQRNQALGKAARFLSDRMFDTELTPDKELTAHQLQLLGTMNPFIHASIELDEMRDGHRHYDKRRARELKTDLISFNHALKDLIDTQPNVTPGDILHFAQNSQNAMGDHKAAVASGPLIREALVGMQHESGAEQILWNIEGVSDIESKPARKPGESLEAYRSRCVDEELHGTDLWVNYNNQWISVDIKASEMSAINGQRKVIEHNGDGIVLWSQLDLEDFNGTFRIPARLAEQKAPAMERELQRALAESPEYASA